MRLSIVSTLYRSAPYLVEFYERSKAAAQTYAGDDFEIILVNDGSPDDSLTVALQLAAKDDRVVVVDLSRNFGHHKAMMTGLAYSSGDYVFLIDSDLEEEPEWLNLFGEEIDRTKCDVVSAVQLKRRGGIVEKLTGALFYRAFRLMTGVNQPDNIMTARLMCRAYVDSLVAYRERELNIGGIWSIVGFDQRTMPLVKHSNSPTTYSFFSKLSHLINAVVSFSSAPLVMTFYCGSAISAGAISYIIYLFVIRTFFGGVPDGYTSLIASIWLFSGLIIFFMGVQGIYLSKVFIEVKRRPYTTVRRVYASKGELHESQSGGSECILWDNNARRSQR
ncbi:glycosyltransferase family 2 protein [Neorhizobium galegae]|uniref:glycosyltransferase family 2 protein n=1 Tax=Neorhizobium galegae TaxID=399 RepID=UPI00127008D4|nr:glycosyltransferase family 2 protein [Neorhizobium galegae]KAA9383087.1 glycosyltransferase family 2 protein [Neorhizobium galegae]MCM2501597.1 glycosyltransferase family 2 protein [Neorhizobium galegae]MCQ1780596.1 glycosyltransferase family 2 protein [Neorhizobium galegae]MCQ1798474.1 glycosyltransferase family 2 protein [Neorhizobium galegae]